MKAAASEGQAAAGLVIAFPGPSLTCREADFHERLLSPRELDGRMTPVFLRSSGSNGSIWKVECHPPYASNADPGVGNSIAGPFAQR